MAHSKHSASLDIDATLACTDENSLDQRTTFESLELFTNPERASLRSRIYLLDMVDVSHRAGTGKRTRMWGVFRPYSKEFMKFCPSYFRHTNIFSAGRPKYVKAMAETLFLDVKSSPSVVFNSENCDIADDNRYVYKRLSDLTSQSALCGEVDEKSIFHLDDREDTISMNIGNGIVIPAYTPNLTGTPQQIINEILKPDVALLQLMCWLLLPEVMYCTDVRTLDKSTIFTTSVETYITQLEAADAEDTFSDDAYPSESF